MPQCVNSVLRNIAHCVIDGCMTLDAYLTSAGMTGTEFAATVGLTEASVSRIRKGQQNISRDVMRRIIAASDGKITAAALVGAAAEEIAA